MVLIGQEDHYTYFVGPDAKIEPLEDIMYWDCFSPYIDVQRRNRLAGLDAELIRPDGKKVLGTYMFTLDWSWENKNT